MEKKRLIIIILVCVLLFGALIARNTSSPKEDQKHNSKTTATITPASNNEQTEEPITAEYTDGITLDILQPQDRSTVTNANLTVKGKTAPSADVFVNDKELKSDAQGYFTVTLTLDEGENPIVIFVNDESGNSAEKELIVTYST